MKRALITGITGQDGSYLAELLLDKGYEVHGIDPPLAPFNTERIDHIYRTRTIPTARLHAALRRSRRRERAAARSREGAARRDLQPRRAEPRRCRSIARVHGATSSRLGTLRLLEAVRDYRRSGKTVRFYQAGSSEMFGAAPPPQSEATPFHPRSPYACAKVCGPLVRRELPRGVRDVHLQRHPVQPRVAPPRRDVRHAQDHPRRGAHQARACRRSSTSATWTQARLGLRRRLRRGDVADAAARRARTTTSSRPASRTPCASSWTSRSRASELDWSEYVEIDPRYFRPTEVDHLHGDASKARASSAGSRRSAAELVRMMMAHDLELARRERT